MSKESLEKIFDGLSVKLQTEFEFFSSQLNHRLSSGMAREYALRELLRQYLPQKLAVGSGLVIATNGDTSRQLDIVIYDALNTPVMYRAGDDAQIFPIESVYAVIEVKSRLNTNTLKTSIDNIRSVKSMPKIAYVPRQGPIIHQFNLYGEELEHFPVMGFVFAYSSVKNIRLLKNKLVDEDDRSNPNNNLDSICILNRAMITNYNPVEQKTYSMKNPDTTRVFIETEKSLLYFYLQLTHALPQASMRPIQMTKYAEHVVYGKIGV